MSECNDKGEECETLPPEVKRYCEVVQRFYTDEAMGRAHKAGAIAILLVKSGDPDRDLNEIGRTLREGGWQVTAGPTVHRQTASGVRHRTRWKMWHVVTALISAAGIATASAVIPFLRSGGGDSKEAGRPAKSALDTVQGPPDTLEVGGEVGTLEKLPEHCFWGVLSNDYILALTYRVAKSSGGKEEVQELFMVFSPDCRSCGVINSKGSLFTGGIYFSNDGGKSFRYTPFPSRLKEKSYLETHADAELQALLLSLALSGVQKGDHGKLLRVRHFPEAFYGLPTEKVSSEIGIEPATVEEMKEQLAGYLVWACAAEERKALEAKNSKNRQKD